MYYYRTRDRVMKNNTKKKEARNRGSGDTYESVITYIFMCKFTFCTHSLIVLLTLVLSLFDFNHFSFFNCFQLNLLRLDIRDQGFTRAKVLILVPFKNSALNIVNKLLQLLPQSSKV